MVVRLEFARLEERDRVLHERHRRQLRQVFVVVERLFTRLDALPQLDNPPLDLVLAHED